MNLSVNLSVNSSFQQILVIWTLFIYLKALNTIGRHVPNVLVKIHTSNVKHCIQYYTVHLNVYFKAYCHFTQGHKQISRIKKILKEHINLGLFTQLYIDP